jgi:hypothetical protein
MGANDKVEAAFAGETNVEKAVRLRLVYDADHSKAEAWLDAEEALTAEQYYQYRAAYRATFPETNKKGTT